MQVSPQDEQRLALFIDFENIAIGVRDAHYRKFDVNLVLERLLDQVSFDAPEMQGREVVIDGGYVRERLESVLQDQDLSRYIL